MHPKLGIVCWFHFCRRKSVVPQSQTFDYGYKNENGKKLEIKIEKETKRGD